ncbi:hypothetical protein [Trueperella sp.]|uniref:hypothetical protein n=1 Tax=Trueperella sp. TaxID=2699835 RepID=UPI0026201F60|nr:hypothetical protein [Trueperella sp.]
MSADKNTAEDQGAQFNEAANERLAAARQSGVAVTLRIVASAGASFVLLSGVYAALARSFGRSQEWADNFLKLFDPLGQPFDPRWLPLAEMDGTTPVLHRALAVMISLGIAVAVAMRSLNDALSKSVDAADPAGNKTAISWVAIRQMHLFAYYIAGMFLYCAIIGAVAGDPISAILAALACWFFRIEIQRTDLTVQLSKVPRIQITRAEYEHLRRSIEYELHPPARAEYFYTAGAALLVLGAAMIASHFGANIGGAVGSEGAVDTLSSWGYSFGILLAIMAVFVLVCMVCASLIAEVIRTVRRGDKLGEQTSSIAISLTLTIVGALACGYIAETLTFTPLTGTATPNPTIQQGWLNNTWGIALSSILGFAVICSFVKGLRGRGPMRGYLGRTYARAAANPILRLRSTSPHNALAAGGSLARRRRNTTPPQQADVLAKDTRLRSAVLVPCGLPRRVLYSLLAVACVGFFLWEGPGFLRTSESAWALHSAGQLFAALVVAALGYAAFAFVTVQGVRLNDSAFNVRHLCVIFLFECIALAKVLTTSYNPSHPALAVTWVAFRLLAVLGSAILVTLALLRPFDPTTVEPGDGRMEESEQAPSSRLAPGFAVLFKLDRFFARMSLNIDEQRWALWKEVTAGPHGERYVAVNSYEGTLAALFDTCAFTPDQQVIPTEDKAEH